MQTSMKTPPIVSPEEWEAAREQMLVKEKAFSRAPSRTATGPVHRATVHVSSAPSLTLASDGAWLEETGVLRRTIGAGHTGSRSSPVC